MRSTKGRSPRSFARLLKATSTGAIILAAAAAMPAYAGTGTVDNPGFEDGTFTGWITEGGNWANDLSWPVQESLYAGNPASLAKIMSATTSDSMTVNGIDYHTGIPVVFAGQYSARLNDNGGYDITALRQTITNYNAPKLYYAWNAVLESSHGETDSDSSL